MKKMKIKVRSMPYGVMVWWDKTEKAAEYIIKLYIGQKQAIKRDVSKGIFADKIIENYQEIDEVVKEKITCYHSFINLADVYSESIYKWILNERWEYHTTYVGLNYFVEVVAEDKNGNVIAQSDKEIFRVETK